MTNTNSIEIINGAKHLNFLDDGRNKYWLNLLNNTNCIFLIFPILLNVQLQYVCKNDNSSFIKKR